MCLIALAIDRSRRFPLVIAANRDEYFARPAARLTWWQPETGGPAILGGRDLQGGGTWLGLTAAGRLAMVTNVRQPARTDPAAPSRGAIVANWLSAREPTDRFWARTMLSGHNGFNLVAADFRQGECFWGSSVGNGPMRLESGVFGVSNALPDAPWPKTLALKDRLSQAIADASSTETLSMSLFSALADRSIAADDDLPTTGVPLERERELSPAFIRTSDQLYGTRCSTLIISERIGRELVTHVMERSFSLAGAALLRQVSLKRWPPRYSDGANALPVAETEVTESEGQPIEPPAAAKRTRVRSLLKPATRTRR